MSPSDTGTNPLDPDTDGDGVNDGDEIAAGTDPNDPGSFPRSQLPVLGGLGSVVLALSLACAGWLRRRRRL